MFWFILIKKYWAVLFVCIMAVLKWSKLKFVHICIKMCRSFSITETWFSSKNSEPDTNKWKPNTYISSRYIVHRPFIYWENLKKEEWGGGVNHIVGMCTIKCLWCHHTPLHKFAKNCLIAHHTLFHLHMLPMKKR